MAEGKPSDVPPKENQRNWAHSKIKPIWNWWEGLAKKNIPLRLFICLVLAVIGFFANKIGDILFNTFYPYFKWRWLVIVFWGLIYLGATALCVWEYKKFKTGRKSSFWNGWGVAVFFGTLFLLQKSSTPVNPNSENLSLLEEQWAMIATAECTDGNIFTHDRSWNEASVKYGNSYVIYFQLSEINFSHRFDAANIATYLGHSHYEAKLSSDGLLADKASEEIRLFPTNIAFSPSSPKLKNAAKLYQQLIASRPELVLPDALLKTTNRPVNQ